MEAFVLPMLQGGRVELSVLCAYEEAESFLLARGPGEIEWHWFREMFSGNKCSSMEAPFSRRGFGMDHGLQV
jgi:hypothetical protein